MINHEFRRKTALIMAEESRYHAEAYEFVANAVSFTTKRLPEHRHVSAEELLEGMRDYARQEFGVVSAEVLYHWGIRTAADAGRIVYLLIGVRLLSAAEGDREEDFYIDFDFSIPLPKTRKKRLKPPVIC
ncbi:MAG: hypothetical protein IJW17_02025 [Lentisphaeria bacterium]|nr:hypothetical protein [Lentisphaeria bacterium]